MLSNVSNIIDGRIATKLKRKFGTEIYEPNKICPDTVAATKPTPM